MSSSKRKKKSLTKAERAFMENCMVDTTQLRTALMMACLELADGDPIGAMELTEYFYDEAPEFQAMLQEEALKSLHQGPAQILDFPQRGS